MSPPADHEKDPWARLEAAEDTCETPQRATSGAPETPPEVTQEAPEEQPNDHLTEASRSEAVFLSEVQRKHDKVRRKNALAALKHSVFVLDDVLPMSFVAPASWGAVRSHWQYRYKGLLVESLTYDNDKTIKRALVPVHGRD